MEFLLWLFFFAERDYYGFVPANVLKVVIPIVLLGGLVLFFLSFMKFRRIDIDADFVYATNYIKTYRYPWHNVQDIKTKKGIIFNTGIVTLKQGGKFGDKMPFLLSNRRWTEFLKEDIYGLSKFAVKE